MAQTLAAAMAGGRDEDGLSDGVGVNRNVVKNEGDGCWIVPELSVLSAMVDVCAYVNFG